MYGVPEAPLSREELLAGAAFSETLPAEQPLPREEVFALDEDMRAFVRSQVEGSRSEDRKLSDLLTGMVTQGLFALDYTTEFTRTAQQTYYERAGNCLSFTMLFVAFAREAGLRATYQVVDVPPTWSSDADLLIATTHINALVKTTGSQADYVVDFNATEFQGNYARREISDDHVLALFYNNLGAEALMRREYGLSFLYLRAALQAYPRTAGAWVNLGLLYARHGLHAHAESAYLQALATDARNGSALANLVGLYRTTGRMELAEHYRKRARHYQQRNPYYHYVLAREAYDAERYMETLRLLSKAIRLKRDEHQFYFLQGLAHAELDEIRSAAVSLGRAKEYAEREDVKVRYEGKLRALHGEKGAAGAGAPAATTVNALSDER